jgi:hypothetical protein
MHSINWPDTLKGPWSLRFHWAVIDGRAECIGLGIGPADEDHPLPVTRSLVRELPIGKLISEELQTYRSLLVALEHGQLPGASKAAKAAARELAPAFSERPQRAGGRRPKYDNGHFAEVAKVYGHAYAAGRTPTRAVAKHFSASPSAAAKWVARARKMGFLGPTDPGVAGGIAKADTATKDVRPTTNRRRTR